MKSLVLFSALIVLMSCQNKSSTPNNTPELDPNETIINDDSYTLEGEDFENIEKQQIKTKINKKNELILQPDDRAALKDVVMTKTIFKDEDDYLIDYTYPYLNEKIDPRYKNFNEYITVNHLNIERTIGEILETTGLLCDTIPIKRVKDKRIIDFKIHSTADKLISILLYKENYYPGMVHSVYMFESLNYDIRKQRFLNFDDFFVPGSQAKIRNLLNTTIRTQIDSGNIYYDCWELSEGDFNSYKDNFVINDDSIEFYFDDCIICPSYTGQYSVDIPLDEIAPFMNMYQRTMLAVVKN